jgi:hypothetical protein
MSPDNIELPPWMPPDAQQRWVALYSDIQESNPSTPFPEALKVLQRIATWPEMRNAWSELKHFANVSPSDLMSTTFSVWLCTTLTRHHKYSRKYLKRYIKLAAITHIATYELQVSPVEASITPLNELKRVATFFERRVNTFQAMLRMAPPPPKVGAHNAAEIAFLRGMCKWLGQRSRRRRPYNLVAILTNVAFDVWEWDSDKVKKNCLRAWSRRSKRGTLLQKKRCNVHRLN